MAYLLIKGNDDDRDPEKIKSHDKASSTIQEISACLFDRATTRTLIRF